jgi:hypothetical protein
MSWRFEMQLRDHRGEELKRCKTVLKVVCDNRGQASMVDAYLAEFCAKSIKETESIEFPSPNADDVVYARDDADESRGSCAEQKRARLGSFGQASNQAKSNTQFIFINPIILSHRSNGSNCLWVQIPSPGTAQNPESE